MRGLGLRGTDGQLGTSEPYVLVQLSGRSGFGATRATQAQDPSKAGRERQSAKKKFASELIRPVHLNHSTRTSG